MHAQREHSERDAKQKDDKGFESILSAMENGIVKKEPLSACRPDSKKGYVPVKVKFERGGYAIPPGAICDVEGFVMQRCKKDPLVQIYRRTGKAEADAMAESKKISRVKFTDRCKWFSESDIHTDQFRNESSKDVGWKVCVWLSGSKYLAIRKQLKHQFLTAKDGSASVFHRELLPKDTNQINVGIGRALDEEFNAAIVDVKISEAKES